MKSGKDVTIYDIARELNISASTVSRGLKDHPHVRKEVKKKILSTARRMGYQKNKFASDLRQKRTHTIGVIVPRLDSYFVSTVISGMEKVANQAGYNLIISQSQESAEKESSIVTTMFNSQVDGLMISLSYNTRNLDHLNILFRKKIPIVFFDRVCDHPRCKSVVINNYRAGYEVTEHLIKQGCRRIVHLGGSLIRNVYNDRYQGYRQALADHNIPHDEKLVIISDLSNQSGRDAARRIMGWKNLPDGLFAANDNSAVSAICELKRSGIKIPEDIAIAGFNNDPVSRVVEPNLTTVHYPGREMGEISADTLIKALNQSQPEILNSIVLSHSLIIRESSRRKSNHG
ncbi:MAG: LacI family DNA-binding transcriptional regulator [Bacteroidales bacterium]